MATTFASVGFTYGSYFLQYDLLSQNYSGNYSTIRLYSFVYCNMANGISWSRGSAVCHTDSFGLATYYPYGNTCVHTMDVNVGHDNNGNCAITIGGSISTTFNFNGYCNGTIYLPQIPRQATLTGANNFNDEQNPYMSFSNPGGYSVKCYLEKSGMTSIVRNNVSGSSCTFNLTDAERTTLRKACTTSNSTSIRYVVQTTIGSSNYWSYADRTLSIVNANPIINAWTTKDSNQTTLNLTNDENSFIKGHSNLTATITEKALPLKEATISKYRLSSGDGFTDVSETTEPLSITLNQITNSEVSLTAYDSRGNLSTNAKQIEKFLEYEIPKINNLEANREDNGVSTRVILSFSGTFWNSTFGKENNTISVLYKYKPNGSEEWIDGTTKITPSISENRFSGELSITGDLGALGFDLDTNFDFKLIVIDKLETIESQITLGAGSPAIAIYKNNISFAGDYNEYNGGRVQVDGIPVFIVIDVEEAKEMEISEINEEI